ncbi:MAG TPA: MmpS family transport accessory protein [Mycobacterium sp.]|nr:MmpS family transport accessory protein [Mycobacterium sp.]HTX97440.1 MmpS family transport accessory protein [Mycobacterium sp.]
MSGRIGGLSVLFAIGVGLSNMCAGTVAGVAHANDFPQVRYEVTGPAVAQYISYQTDTGQQRAVNTPLPWSTQFTAFGGQVFVLSAQGTGTLRCRILVNGNVVSDAQSAGGKTVCSH